MLMGRLVHLTSTNLKSFKEETHAAGVMVSLSSSLNIVAADTYGAFVLFHQISRVTSLNELSLTIVAFDIETG
jgi:hypothetical protein